MPHTPVLSPFQGWKAGVRKATAPPAPPETRGLRRAMPRLGVATPSPSRAAGPFLPLAAVTATATATASGWLGGAALGADPGTWQPRPGRLFF